MLLYICVVFVGGGYVTEGALHRHILRSHGGPVSFEVGMNEKHSPKYMIKVPLSY